MPELPEVHTIARVLNENIKGYKINKVQIHKGFGVGPSKEVFLKSLTNSSIKNITNFAKNIVVKLDNEMYMIVHLAMTGQLVFKKFGTKPSAWERVTFTLSKEGKSLYLVYNDMRMFGKLEIKTTQEFEEYKLKYGINPLNKEVTTDMFHTSITSRKTSIKNILLDQKVIAGVGNIYANDALFMAGIDPKKVANKLTKQQSELLLSALRKILNESILHRGSTLSDEMFVDPFGRKGSHQKYFRIYGKKTCPSCQKPVSFEKINGRGTYYCKSCQI